MRCATSIIGLFLFIQVTNPYWMFEDPTFRRPDRIRIYREQLAYPQYINRALSKPREYPRVTITPVTCRYTVRGYRRDRNQHDYVRVCEPDYSATYFYNR